MQQKNSYQLRLMKSKINYFIDYSLNNETDTGLVADFSKYTILVVYIYIGTYPVKR